MTGNEIRSLRSKLDVSRAGLARFIGVSEATIARWEAAAAITEPRGLQAFLLQTLEEAVPVLGAEEVGRLVRSCGDDYRAALRGLLGSGR